MLDKVKPYLKGDPTFDMDKFNEENKEGLEEIFKVYPELRKD